LPLLETLNPGTPRIPADVMSSSLGCESPP
jgi:hypothetical protein